MTPAFLPPSFGLVMCQIAAVMLAMGMLITTAGGLWANYADEESEDSIQYKVMAVGFAIILWALFPVALAIFSIPFLR